MKIKKIILIVLISMVAGIVSGCTSTGTASSWPGINVDGEDGYFAYGTQVFAIDVKNGSLVWRYPSEADAKLQFYAAPAVSENQVIAGSYLNTLVALDRANGTEEWVFSQAEDRYIGTPLVVNEFIFAPNTDKYLYALSSSGDFLWTFKTEGPNWTKPLSDKNMVYLASMDHNLYALKMEYSSNELALDKNGSRTLVSNPLWKVNLETAVVADPVLSDGKIYVATIDGKLHCVDTESGKLLWSFSDGNQYRSVWGSPVVTDEAVYFGDETGNLFAVSPVDGSPIWPIPYSAGASIIASGVETDEGALFVTEEGRVFLINVDKEPKPVVSLDMVMYASPKLADGKIVLAPATKEKLFMAIDLDGKEIWSFIPSK